MPSDRTIEEYKKLGTDLGKKHYLYPFCDKHWLYYISEVAALCFKLDVSYELLTSDIWLRQMTTLGHHLLSYYHRYNFYHSALCACKNKQDFQCELCVYLKRVLFFEAFSLYKFFIYQDFRDLCAQFFDSLKETIKNCRDECKKLFLE